MIIKELVRGEHKIIVKLGIKLANGEQLYNLEYQEYFPSLQTWRTYSTEKNYSKSALELLGINI